MDLQEKEEEEEKSRDAAEKLDEEESQDMFAPTQENPFLASRETPKMHLLPSQSKEKARNPFAKRTESTSSPGYDTLCLKLPLLCRNFFLTAPRASFSTAWIVVRQHLQRRSEGLEKGDQCRARSDCGRSIVLYPC